MHQPHAQNTQQPDARPGGAAGAAPPRVVAWEVTRSCNLACVHCRASAIHGPYEGELSTEECFTLVDQIASFARP
ncbi:MAG TPA: radical SAM/SPASM domain-containing protein, partial [Thermoleophilia bacterium]|nr:radical SAM/SPASM domain-containing protein [Thermoleophilia bacterium]